MTWFQDADHDGSSSDRGYLGRNTSLELRIRFAEVCASKVSTKDVGWMRDVFVVIGDRSETHFVEGITSDQTYLC